MSILLKSAAAALAVLITPAVAAAQSDRDHEQIAGAKPLRR